MSAQRIIRPTTAFQLTSSAKRRPRQHHDSHLDFIRGLPCVVTGFRPVDAAHVRYGNPHYGKAAAGAAEKPGDQWTVPLCRAAHADQHARGDERAWWAAKEIDPLEVCCRLWAVSGDQEAGEMVIAAYRMRP